MKKAILIGKWVLAFIVTGLVIYTGYEIRSFISSFFYKGEYKGKDGKQSKFEKNFPNIAEARDGLIYGGEYKGKDGIQSKFEKNFPNIAEARDSLLKSIKSIFKR